MHPLVVQALAAERHRRLVDDAARYRLHKGSGQASPPKIRLAVARILIGAGRRLAGQRPAQGSRTACSGSALVA